MDTKFSQLHLNQVQSVLSKPTGHASLVALLRLANPDFDSTRWSDETYLRKSFRNLLRYTHPDKHPRDAARATEYTQRLGGVDEFLKKCRRFPRPVAPPPRPSSSTRDNSGASNGFSFGFAHSTTRTQSRRRTPSRSNRYPSQFHVQAKWPHVQYNEPQHHPHPAPPSPSQLSSLVAHQCVNCRGAIAHGKPIGLVFNSAQATAGNWTSVRALFIAGGGGCKELEDVDAIKEEIILRGPVVTTSFRPSTAFVQHNHNISQGMLSIQRDFLIVGWELRECGEVWLIQPLYSNSNTSTNTLFGPLPPPIPAPIPVAIGQWCVDDVVLAPKRDFSDQSWEHGPYLDITVQKQDEATWWQQPHAGPWGVTLTPYVTHLDTLTQLEGLLQGLGKMEFGAATKPGAAAFGASGDAACGVSASQREVTLRNRSRHAHSRRGMIQSIEWVGNKWEVTVAWQCANGSAGNNCTW